MKLPLTRILRTMVLGTTLCALLGCLAAQTADGGPIHLVVLHTNDVHGQLLPLETEAGPRGGLLRLAEEVRAVRERSSSEGAQVLLLDAGDWTQGTPEGRARAGVPFVTALQALGYDALCIGNHELDLGRGPLEALLERVRPPTVLANVHDPATGTRVGWAPPWRIVERAGLRIGVVGLLSTSTPRLTHPDAAALEFRDPVAALAQALVELRALDVDLVVPLTHLGLEDDERLARAFADEPLVPVIIGGHSHTFLSAGRRVGPTLLAQAGQKAQVLGRVDLWLERGSARVSSARAALVELPADEQALASAERRNPALAALCRELLHETGLAWARAVGRLGAPLARTREPRSSSAGNLVADTLRAQAGADVGLHNKGGLRRDLAAGAVSARELFELLPFDNTVVVLELSGAELERLLRHAIDGRRGLSIELGGAVLEIAEHKNGLRLEALRIAGAPLEHERTYRLATNSFLARGGDGVLPPELLDRGMDTGVLLRDALQAAFAAHGTLSPSAENRLYVRPARD